jgi:hypothetical protein
MNKNDLISEAVATIPAWLAFLEVKEQEQQTILSEITQQAEMALPLEKVDLVEHVGSDQPTTAVPLAWLDEDMPPPTGEPQQPVAEPSPPPSSETDETDIPPWDSELGE